MSNTRPLQQPVDDLVAAFLGSRHSWSDGSRVNATSILNRWCKWLAAHYPGVELGAATRQMCDGYLAARRAGTTGVTNALTGEPLPAVGPTTVHKEFQILGWLYEWLVAEGEVPMVKRKMGTEVVWVDPPGFGPMDGIHVPAPAEPDPQSVRHITDGDYRTLMATFDKRRTLDCRNAAICSLMYWSGVRRSEVVRIDVVDYDKAKGTLMVAGKGRNGQHKWRRVILLDETRQLLDRYLRRRADDPADALFASTLAGHDATGSGRLHADAVSAMLERRCDKLGIHVSAHQFRRSATASAKRRGISETEIARQQGWSPESARRMFPRYTASQADDLTEEAYRTTDPTVGRAPRTRRLRAV